MGALLVLLTVAATSVTYGWQPDNKGGVEYLVQVAPDKLAQVRDAGEISSAIPAEIRGHVSRVVIRVGNGPLPKVLPESIRMSAQHSPPSGAISQSDRQVIPIPQIDSSSNIKRVMKPQNGFSVPDMTNGARNAASNAMNGVMNSTMNTAGSAVDNLRNRTNAAIENAADRVSNATRDNQWSLLQEGQRPSTDDVRAPGTPQYNSPRSNPYGGTGYSTNIAQRDTSSQRNTNSQRNISSQTQPPFVGPTLPSGFSRGYTSDSSRSNTPYSQSATNDMRRGNTFSNNSSFDNTRGSTNDMSMRSNPAGFGLNNFGKMPAGIENPQRMTAEEERQRLLSRRNEASGLEFAQNRLSLGNTRSTNNYSRGTYDDRGSLASSLPNDTQSPDYRMPNDSRRTMDDSNRQSPTWSGFSSESRSNSLANSQQREQDVDSRLSKADRDRLPAGAYSFDIHGNPVDRDGRVLDHLGNRVPWERAIELTTGRNKTKLDYPTIATLPGVPNQTMHAPNLAVPNVNTHTPALGVNAPGQGINRTGQVSVAPGGVPASHYHQPPYPNDQYASNNGGPRTSGPESHSDFDRSNEDKGSDDKRRSLATQPLFTFLLLISIVANFYLVFWLKNLRHQFHALVSSKRVPANEPIGI